MYDFSTVIPHYNTLDENLIYDSIGDEFVFRHYFGEFKLGKAYKSVFQKDDNPSSGFYITKTGRIIYNHFNGAFPKMNCIQFVATLFNLTTKEAILKIAEDFSLFKTPGLLRNVSRQFHTKPIQKEEKVLQVTLKPYTKDSLRFWNAYSITKTELLSDEIFLLDKLFINKIQMDLPDYSYVKVEGEYIKVYSPFAERSYKWFTNTPLHHPYGLQSIKFDTHGFVTKSFKDRLILKKFSNCVITTQNESLTSLVEEVQSAIISSCEVPFIWYDADIPGKTAMKAFTRFNQIHTPDEDYEYFNIKDPSDYVKFYGLKKFKQLYDKFTNNCPR